MEDFSAEINNQQNQFKISEKRKYNKLLLLISFCTALNLKSIVAQQLKPGDADPKVKIIDADVMQEFNNGAAVIQKRNAYALIDKNGNMLASYNQYDFYYYITQANFNRQYNGIFILGSGKGATPICASCIFTPLPRRT